MSEDERRSITVNVKDLSFKSDQHVEDLVRFLAESLPQINLNRDGNEITISMPVKLSKRALRLRIKKFLHKKGLNKDFRPISLNLVDKEGYIVKEKKIIELSYY
ncbi:MAG: 60S ribosomal protein L22 [Candidatus Thorarchaeota archaeon]